MRSVPFEGTCCGYSSSYFYFFSTFPVALAQRTKILTTEKEGAPSTDEAMEYRENSRGILVRTCRRSAGAGFHQHRLGGATLCVGIQRSFDVFGETFNALRWETHLVIILLLHARALSLSVSTTRCSPRRRRILSRRSRISLVASFASPLSLTAFVR